MVIRVPWKVIQNKTLEKKNLAKLLATPSTITQWFLAYYIVINHSYARLVIRLVQLIEAELVTPDEWPWAYLQAQNPLQSYKA
jgi:hypothetical protein